MIIFKSILIRFEAHVIFEAARAAVKNCVEIETKPQIVDLTNLLTCLHLQIALNNLKTHLKSSQKVNLDFLCNNLGSIL
jgi:hypothetical protein